MVGPSTSPNDEKHPIINRGRVEFLNLYEVKENELELLEKGSDANLQLSFAIFLFSTALTCAAALATSSFKWKIAESIFTFIIVVGLLLGTYLVISWWRSRKSIRKGSIDN